MRGERGVMNGNENAAGVAVLGFGVAGFNAALALRNAGYGGTVRVFSDTPDAPYSPILTSYYAGGRKSREECFPWSREATGSLGLAMEGAVRRLDTASHTVFTDDGAFPYEKCVIATGATPTCAGFPPECGYDPLVLRTMDDAERLKSAITRPGCERVLVSGASMVALKMLEACLWRGLDATLVGMNPHVLDFNALPASAERFERGLVKKGVSLRLGQTIRSVRVVEDPAHPLGRRLEVAFSNGDADAFDEIAVAHGMRCNLDFLDDGAIETDRAILVDDAMRTSDADVYAAGDVAQATELVSGEKRVVGIWKNAAVQGQCAGTAIACELMGEPCGREARFGGSIPSNTIAVDGTLFISAGTVELGEDREVEVREEDDMTVVYVYEAAHGADEADAGAGAAPRRLVGFNITSDVDEEGGRAYDTGAMLTMRIEQGCRDVGARAAAR